MLSFIISKKWWVLLGLVVVVGGGFLVWGGGEDAPNTTTVQRGDVVSEVSVTGTVEPAQNIDLGFEVGGRIESIFAGVGDRIFRGQTLARLESGELAAQLAQAEAKLQELKSGARPEEIRAKEIAIESAKETLENYYEDAVNTIEDSYSKADDAVRTKTDAMFSGDEGDNPQLTYTSLDSQAEREAERLRRDLQGILTTWNERVRGLSAEDRQGVESELVESRSHLTVVVDFLSYLQDTLNNPPGLSQSTIDSYRADVNTGRTNVVGAISNLDNIRQSIQTQKTNIREAENALELVLAGEKPEKIAAQEAQVDYYRSQLAKRVITAPFSGTITRVTQDPGEITAANQEIVSLIGEGAYLIEVFVTESDISDVSVGDTATVTLDAYGSDELFEARVAAIDIGATELEGVATYKTTLEFLEEDERIRPGLTADVDVLNEKKEDVLYVPTRNIISKDGAQYVRVPSGEVTKDIEIETGLRGSDGRTEVISGLEEGDVIITE